MEVCQHRKGHKLKPFLTNAWQWGKESAECALRYKGRVLIHTESVITLSYPCYSVAVQQQDRAA